MEHSQTDHLKLEKQLCFPLYAASKEITQRYGRYLSDLDITYTQYLVLMILWEEQTLTVNEIGKRLLLDSGTLTPLLKRLENKELVVRTRKKEDERIVMVTLTGLGMQLREKATCIPQQLFENIGLTESEIGLLKELCKKILDKLGEAK